MTDRPLPSRPNSHIKSELFASSPIKRERRRKRDVLRSWTADLFGKDMTSSTNRTTILEVPPAPQHPLSFPTAQKESENNNHLTVSSGKSISRSVGTKVELDVAAKVKPATRALLSEIRHAVTSKDGMVSVPPLSTNRTLTPLEQEFRDMLTYFSVYTKSDMLGIQDPTKRVLYQGIAASTDCPAVYRAFEILFQDLPPLRLAGRVVFKLLRKFMVQSVGQHKEEIALLSNLVSASPDGTQQLEELRLLFIMAASQLNGAGELTTEQLLMTGVVNRTAHDVLGFHSPSQLIDRLELTEHGRVTFVNLVTGLWNCAEDVCGLEHCDPQRVLYELLIEMNDQLAGSITVDTVSNEDNPSKIKNGARYDSMVASFVEWKDLLPNTEEGQQEIRRVQVIRGCFVGAEIPEIVDALRIVYMEYRGLRIAGDFIFKLVSQRMKRRKVDRTKP